MSALSVKGITKVFGATVANRDITFDLQEGEILAVLGENGAGKTTLMRVIYGMETPDSGEVWLNGAKVDITSPKQAIQLGIGMVHQHFMLVNNFTVAENMALGLREVTGGVLHMKELNKKVEEFFATYHFNIPPDAIVGQLPIGLQQRVEIMKALFRGANVLVLDEPTAVLTPQETQELFGIVRSLQDQGKSIIFISHKLDEVMEISQRVMILRLGEVSGIVNTAEVDQKTLARLMIGRELEALEKSPLPVGTKQVPVLEVDDYQVCSGKKNVVKNVSFKVWSHEVLGIAGVDGNGQKELVEAITGLVPAAGGTVRLNNAEITGMPPRKIRRAGLSHVPEDRRARGLILSFDLVENRVLVDYYRPPFAKGILRQKKAEVEAADKMIKDYKVKTAGARAKASSLSGGNQQKVIVARELSAKPELLVAAKPTRGLDVGAVQYIHQCILEVRDSGKAVLLISSELEEIMSLSDRIMVMHNGEIMGLVYPDQVNAEILGEMMAGVRKDFSAAQPRKGAGNG